MFQCKDLLNLPSLARARVVSGKNGLKKQIRWVYKPENMNFERWVKGHELLIISTPVIKSKGFNLEELIKKADRLGLSGALLLTGDKYIEDVASSIITYSNLRAFPIFTIEGDTPLIDIFEEIGHAIAYHSEEVTNGEGILSSVILGRSFDTSTLELIFNESGLTFNAENQIFVINLRSQNRIENYDIDSLMGIIKEYFNSIGFGIIMSRFAGNIIGCTEKQDEVNNGTFKKLFDLSVGHLENVKVNIGVGNAYNHPQYLKKSFDEASRCIILSEKMKQDAGVFSYSQLGIYSLFLEMEESVQAKEFIDVTLGSIISYDRDNNSNLLETLRAFLWSNNSLLHASKKLVTHRNTVKYRINKVSEITGKDFDDAMTKIEFMNAIILNDIMN